MAKSSVLYLMLLAFLPAIAISCSQHHKHGLKSKHFTLYQRDIVNQTDFLIVAGVAGSNFTETAAPFGTITVLKDNLTLTPDPSSKVVGNCEAVAIAVSFDGLDNLSIIRFALDLDEVGLTGTISTLGVINTLKPSDIPVTGGTKDFLLVQGHITSSLVSIIEGLIFVYKVDFHLFWPSHAPYALKG